MRRSLSDSRLTRGVYAISGRASAKNTPIKLAIEAAAAQENCHTHTELGKGEFSRSPKQLLDGRASAGVETSVIHESLSRRNYSETRNEMSVFNTKDLSSEINTILHKPEEPMETTNGSSQQSTPRKSILKTPNSSFTESEVKKEYNDFINQTLQSDVIPRPHSLEDFLRKETITENCDLQSTFDLNRLTEDEEIWIVDIPGTINPQQLKGQILQLGDKSKFKVGEDRYCAINRDSKSSLTCVFNDDKQSEAYKTVNIKPAGTISIRRKLSGSSKIKLEYDRNEKVPYPKNIKIRHPFFGVQSDDFEVKHEGKC